MQLVRLGIGASSDAISPDHVDWPGMQAIAKHQGLVALDGIDNLPHELKPKKLEILQWIGVTLQQESHYLHESERGVKGKLALAGII